METTIRAMRAEGGFGKNWQWPVLGAARLALASREPAEWLVREEDLDALPSHTQVVAAVLRRAGLLRARSTSAPARLPTRPKAERGRRWARPSAVFGSCYHCLAWIGGGDTVCDCCSQWKRGAAVASCRRCRRELPLRKQLCRFCRLLLAENPLDDDPVEQLWFGGEFAPRLHTKDQRFGNDKRQRVAQRHATAARQAAKTASAHLIDPAQYVLVDGLRREWSQVDLSDLPKPTAAAGRLLSEFGQHARAHAWIQETRDTHLRVLRIAVSWLGIAAPLLQTDLVAIAALSPNHNFLRLVPFLADHGLLVANVAAPVDADQAGVDRMLAQLPETLRPEVTAWVRVLRGEGRKPSPRRDWPLIRRYLMPLVPILQRWAARTDTLRSITTDDIETEMNQLRGHAGYTHVALRSVFRALKRERIIFHDPARRVSIVRAQPLPRPLPSDRLVGLLDKAPTALAKLAAILIAVHALGCAQVRRLHLDDLDRSTGRLVVHRAGADHIVVLDEYTLTLIAAWTRERTRRYPRSVNPHLLVSQRTATSTTPMSRYGFARLFDPLEIAPERLRVDRLLDEAQHTGDPVQLMRIFGLSKTTAMKYVTTAHPELFTIDPTHP